MTGTNLLLTSRDVAELLRVHPKQIYRLLKRGLPAVRVGDEWRFERDQVLAWARTRARRAAPPARDAETPDALVSAPGTRVAAPGSEGPAPRSVAPPLLAANGDRVIELLLAALYDARAPLVGFVLADHAGARGLLAQGHVLLAGQHADAPRAEALGPVARLQLVTREVGLATRRGLRLRQPSAVLGKSIASRPPTAGVRRLFDKWLEREGVEPRRVYERGVELRSHRDVALAVSSGQTDVGLLTQAWARSAGLEFFALGSESYELVVPASQLEDARVIAVCELVQSGALRAELRDQLGYGVSRMGQLRVAGSDAAP